MGISPLSAGHELRLADLVRLSLRAFTVKPTRTVLTIVGSSVGIATVIVLVSLGYGLQNILLGKLITTQDSLITLETYYPSEANLLIDARQVGEVAAMPDVAEVSTVEEIPGEAKLNDISGLIVLRFVDAAYFRLAGIVPDIGKDFGDQYNGVVITSQALHLLNLPADRSSIGKSIALAAFFENKVDGTAQEIHPTSAFTIAGIITDEKEPPIVIVNPDLFPQKPDTYKEIFVRAKSDAVLEPLRDALISKGYIIAARIDLVQQAKKVTNVITIVLGVFGVAALLVSAIGMFNTMIVGFLERIYEVGVMKALGATDHDVRNLFLMESFIMGVSGGLSGVILGVGGSKIINYILNLAIARLGSKPIDLFSTPLWFVGLVLGLSALIGLASGLIPARRARLLSPKEAFLRK